MGIPGLERQLWNNEGCVLEVSISELAEKDGKSVIVVDGFQFYGQYLYPKFDWICGGLRKLVKEVETFVKAFERIGVKLVFFFVEGHLDEGADDLGSHSWTERRSTFIDYTKKLFQVSSRSCALEHLKREREYYHTPLHAQSVVLYALRRILHCEVQLVYAGDRCDTAAYYTTKNNCLALLAQDNYYIFYHGVPHYLSLKNLNLEHMTTVKYSPQGLAKLRNLKSHLYPIFFDPKYELNLCQKRKLVNICQKLEEYERPIIAIRKILKWVDGENIDPDLNLGCVCEQPDAEELESCTERMQELLPLFFGQLLRYKYYKYELRLAPVYGPLQKWKLIKLRAKELYTSGAMSIRIGQILASKTFYNDCILEDFCDLPPSSVIYISLRKKLYGVLFHETTGIDCRRSVTRECSSDEENSDSDDEVAVEISDNDCRIEEWVMVRKGCIKSPETIIPELIDPDLHPGLLVLWDLSNTTNHIQDNKWKLFSKCISMNLDSELLRKLPPTLVIPTTVLYYLYNNVPDTFKNKQWKFIQPWEVEVFIAQAVMLNNRNVNSLSTAKSQYNERVVKLMSLFVYGCQMMRLLVEACGYPISEDDLCLWHFLDGELLQSFYKNSEWKRGAAHLCDTETRPTFLQMRNIILPETLPSSRQV